MLAELLDERVHLGMHHHLVLIPDAVLSQEVKLDMVTRHALNILNLNKTTTQALTTDMQQHRRNLMAVIHMQHQQVLNENCIKYYIS